MTNHLCRHTGICSLGIIFLSGKTGYVLKKISVWISQTEKRRTGRYSSAYISFPLQPPATVSAFLLRFYSWDPSPKKRLPLNPTVVTFVLRLKGKAKVLSSTKFVLFTAHSPVPYQHPRPSSALLLLGVSFTDIKPS